MTPAAQVQHTVTYEWMNYPCIIQRTLVHTFWEREMRVIQGDRDKLPQWQQRDYTTPSLYIINIIISLTCNMTNKPFHWQQNAWCCHGHRSCLFSTTKHQHKAEDRWGNYSWTINLIYWLIDLLFSLSLSSIFILFLNFFFFSILELF